MNESGIYKIQPLNIDQFYNKKNLCILTSSTVLELDISDENLIYTNSVPRMALQSFWGRDTTKGNDDNINGVGRRQGILFI